MKFLSLLACTALLCACSSTKSSAPAMSEADMQAAWMVAMTPGPNHKLLDPMVGTWRTAVKSRMGPDAPWTEESGTCQNRFIFGGRYLESNFNGTFMGMPFEGRGLMGYDNTAKEFVGFWSDNFSTTLAPVSRGQVDATGTVFTLHREMADPITGQWTKMREITTVEGPNAHRMDTYCQQGDGPEYHMMTLHFTR